MPLKVVKRMKLLAFFHSFWDCLQQLGRPRREDTEKAPQEEMPLMQTPAQQRIALVAQEDAFVAQLMEVMEKQMSNNTLTVEELVHDMQMGRTVFFVTLKEKTGVSPVQFIREMRLQRAVELLKDPRYNITEVTYKVGMNDSRYFAKCFKSTYGMTPTEYKHAVLRDE